MARRANHRIPIRLPVELCCNDKVYTGTVMNISEYGMFITTNDQYVPEARQFDLTMPIEKVIARIPVKIKRFVPLRGGSCGLALELLDPPAQYISYVENLMMLM